MKCSSCGKDNPQGTKFCGHCGTILVSQGVEQAPSGNRYCVQCGRVIGWDANACMYCGHDFVKKAKPGTEGFLMTGSVLTMVAGVLGAALLTILAAEWGDWSATETSLLVISYTCSILGVIGGLASLMRVQFPVAVLGAACAIFTPAFFFAIPGLVLIARSASSFKDYEKNPAQT